VFYLDSCLDPRASPIASARVAEAEKRVRKWVSGACQQSDLAPPERACQN
jgi:hypothetical protein